MRTPSSGARPLAIALSVAVLLGFLLIAGVMSLGTPARSRFSAVGSAIDDPSWYSTTTNRRNTTTSGSTRAVPTTPVPDVEGFTDLWGPPVQYHRRIQSLEHSESVIAIVGGTVAVATRFGGVLGNSLADGERTWNFVPKMDAKEADGSPVVTAAHLPALDSVRAATGMFIVGDYFGSYAVDPETGLQLWSTTEREILVSRSGDELFSVAGGKVKRIARESGAVLWTHVWAVSTPIFVASGPDPVLVDEEAITVLDGASGSVRWAVPRTAPSSMAVATADTVIVVDRDGEAEARDLRDGSERWHRRIDARLLLPAKPAPAQSTSNSDLAFLPAVSQYLALAPGTGETRWTAATSASNADWTTADARNLIVGANSSVRVFDATSGEVVARWTDGFRSSTTDGTRVCGLVSTTGDSRPLLTCKAIG